MYHSYFGLQEQVFSIAVDPHYLYMSSQHREALAHLLYGVSSGGFVLLTGEVGTGKTTIVRCLLEQLPDNTELGIILNPVATAPELLGNICDEYGIAYSPGETSLKVLTDKLYQHLLANHTSGRNTVLLIDEAQLLSVATLEQIRLLTNLETNTRKLMQIILVGQPELNQILAQPSLRQLSQRITARYHLRALTLADTYVYISHRLSVAGLNKSQPLFPAKMIRKIYQASRGIPRLINVLCDRMLLGAYSQDKAQVDEAVCRQARLEVLGEEKLERSRSTDQAVRHARWSYALAGGLTASLVIATVALWPLPADKNLQTPLKLPAPALAAVSDAEPVAPDLAPTMPSLAAFGYREQSLALNELVQSTGSSTSAVSCENTQAANLQCELRHLASWNELQRLNRPAVLKLVTPAKRERFAALVGLDDNIATLSHDGQLHTVALSELGPLWTGEALYLWHKPTEFTGPVGYGAQGPVVDWIAAQFAQLDGQDEPLAQGRFNTALADRVKIFQRSQQLQDDGIFGARTLMALNLKLNIDKSLADTSALSRTER